MSSRGKRTAASISSGHSDEVYEYKGGLGVPQDVVSVKFHPDVTSVDDNAFQYCRNLREVVFNEGLRSIGKNAFQYCEFESITFPSTLEEIGEEAFLRCNGLKKVVFNTGLQKVEAMAFMYCSLLLNVDLSSTNIETLEADVFYGCKQLEKVVFNEGIKKIDSSFNQCISLVDVNFPSSLIEIKDCSFYSCKMRVVELKEGLKEIEGSVFGDNSLLESITLPSTITEIQNDAIEECTNLREIVMLNQDIRVYEKEYDDHYNDLIQIETKKAFLRCPSLTYISFPSLFSRLEDIVLAGQTQARTKINDIHGVEIRDGKVSISATFISEGQSDYSDEESDSDNESRPIIHLDWSAVREKRGMILDLIVFYEKREATCLFELALWKARISIAEDNQNPIDREACRIDVPGPVKYAILQYL